MSSVINSIKFGMVDKHYIEGGWCNYTSIKFDEEECEFTMDIYNEPIGGLDLQMLEQEDNTVNKSTNDYSTKKIKCCDMVAELSAYIKNIRML